MGEQILKDENAIIIRHFYVISKYYLGLEDHNRTD